LRVESRTKLVSLKLLTILLWFRSYSLDGMGVKEVVALAITLGALRFALLLLGEETFKRDSLHIFGYSCDYWGSVAVSGHRAVMNYMDLLQA
jgi:hypothetical protein